ncbi:MAG: putative glycoside hydrolase, partial [Candidatus Uhrbacteria bacterium]
MVFRKDRQVRVVSIVQTSGFNIGQRLIDAYPFADFISPMVYPSHYQWNFHGLGNPAEHPYEIITSSLTEGAQQLVNELLVSDEKASYKFRPWLQDFDIGAVYDSHKIQEQIRAVRDAGASGWIMWNARNVY